MKRAFFPLGSRTVPFPAALLVPLIFVCAIAGKAPSPGSAPWTVKEVRFSGNVSKPAPNLIALMQMRPGTWLRKTKFSRWTLADDLDALLAAYQDDGFIDAAVSLESLMRDTATRTVRIRIAVSEGPRTFLDSVHITGCTAFTPVEARGIVSSKAGGPFCLSCLDRDAQAIADSIRERGYWLCTAKVRAGLDTARRRAAAEIVVSQGPLSFAGGITVRGTKRIRNKVALREIAFRAGDTLTGRAVRSSERRLYETGLFRYARVAPFFPDTQAAKAAAAYRTPVEVSVDETDFFAVQGGVGYGTNEGPRASLETSYGNCFGFGHTVALQGSYSRFLESVRVRYATPRILSLPVSGDASVYAQRHDEITFKGNLYGAEMTLGAKSWGKLGYRSWTSFEWVKDEGTPAVQPDTGQPSNTHSVGLGVSYDLRNNVFDPSKGIFVSVDATVAGFAGMGSSRFYKLTLDFRWHLPVFPLFSVSGAVNAGYARGYGSDGNRVPPQELFYAGGEKIRQIRGYPVSGTEPGGGSVALVLNIAEFRWSMLPWFEIAGFADAGYVWPEPNGITLKNLLYTAGPGLRFRTPVGIISCDYGFRLNGTHVGAGGFSLEIGQPF
jgi:outer membrane protein assembly complex protein YaeT